LLSSLHPISLAELEVGKTHRGCAVYCKIATRVLHLESAMVLVQDESDIKNLALYGNVISKDLKVGRLIAIKEPFYKMRNDGSEGIRIDDPAHDLVFDPEILSKKIDREPKGGIRYVRATVEDRVIFLTGEDETKGADKIYTQLIDEGYDITKKRVRALKKAAALHRKAAGNASGNDNDMQKNDVSIVSVISERRPEKHRILKVPLVFENKTAGNEAFVKKHFEEADKFYSKALKHKNDLPEESGEEVGLWQLYCNRSAARMKMGLLHEALQDSLMANMCAESNTTKPLLRCAEALAALGLHKDAKDLLESTADAFHDSREMIEKKKELLSPKIILRVGKNSDFLTITEAIRHAPAGSEILVDTGTYRETIIITKPITLRCNDVNDFDAIQSLEDTTKDTSWAEIFSSPDMPSIICNPAQSTAPIHIIGFKIFCDAPPANSVAAARVMRGVTVFRNCVLSSTSGPVVCVESPGTKLLMHACVVHRGAQGGILCVDSARLSLHQIHCCNNAASGLELRSKGCANIEGCHFYRNGRQGIISWQGAGKLTAAHCEIHSHQYESGVLVNGAETELKSCKIYGNNLAGVVSQQKGNLLAIECEVHNNCEGILIQDTGCARVEHCNTSSNRANGIFVGFDHRGKAAIIENKACNNTSQGIMIGNSGNVVCRGNTESGNLRLPPSLSGVNPDQMRIDKKYFQRVKKNKNSIEKAVESNSFIDSLLKQAGMNHQAIFDDLEMHHEQCSFCHLQPPKDKPFSKCKRCRQTSYCSQKCQKNDWSKHKETCRDASVKYPSFLDPNVSV
jgi:tetratricopeptide (TPR) repeat protein